MLPQKISLLSGITGQAGSFLAEHLLSKGHYVVGIKRRSSTNNLERIKHLLDNQNFELVDGDVTDYGSIFRIVEHYFPDYIFNLAAQSHVHTSFEQPNYTTDVTYGGCLNFLEILRKTTKLINKTRFFNANSSEMFGDSIDIDGRQRETTPFNPRSPYAIAKLACHHLIDVYRKSYGIFCSSGIMFNYESNRRLETFVTRKITQYVAAWEFVKRNNLVIKPLHLGNINAWRDWSSAKDVVRAMLMILEYDKPDDFVIASGETRTVYDFLKTAFGVIGVEPILGNHYVLDESLKRPCEVPLLRGDATKAKSVLGWVPEISFEELVKEMVNYDRKQLGNF